jgi:hypothetical protein
MVDLMKRVSALALMLVAAISLTGCRPNYVTGSGTKVGTIIQISYDGTLVKTHEIEVVRGGMSNGSGGFSTKPFFATITDPGLLAKAQDAFDKQYEVNITYTEYWSAPLASDNDDNAFVNSIEPAK